MELLTYRVGLQASKNVCREIIHASYFGCYHGQSSMLKCRKSMGQVLSSLSLFFLFYFSCKMKILYTCKKKIKKKKKKLLQPCLLHCRSYTLPELGRTVSWCQLERGTPQSFLTFPTSPMDLFNPLSRPANSTASPIK